MRTQKPRFMFLIALLGICLLLFTPHTANADGEMIGVNVFNDPQRSGSGGCMSFHPMYGWTFPDGMSVYLEGNISSYHPDYMDNNVSTGAGFMFEYSFLEFDIVALYLESGTGVESNGDELFGNFKYGIGIRFLVDDNRSLFKIGYRSSVIFNQDTERRTDGVLLGIADLLTW